MMQYSEPPKFPKHKSEIGIDSQENVTNKCINVWIVMLEDVFFLGFCFVCFCFYISAPFFLYKYKWLSLMYVYENNAIICLWVDKHSLKMTSTCVRHLKQKSNRYRAGINTLTVCRFPVTSLWNWQPLTQSIVNIC